MNQVASFPSADTIGKQQWTYIIMYNSYEVCLFLNKPRGVSLPLLSCDNKWDVFLKYSVWGIFFRKSALQRFTFSKSTAE